MARRVERNSQDSVTRGRLTFLAVGSPRAADDDRGARAHHPPSRSLQDSLADPPLANVFGALKSRADYGTVKKLGGVGREWRESKVGRDTSVGPYFGPKPKAKLRVAFLQHTGFNSVPRSAPHADFDGGRITHFAVARPGTCESNPPSPTGTRGGGGGGPFDETRSSVRSSPRRGGGTPGSPRGGMMSPRGMKPGGDGGEGVISVFGEL